jgi:hypothetical protein
MPFVSGIVRSSSVDCCGRHFTMRGRNTSSVASAVQLQAVTPGQTDAFGGSTLGPANSEGSRFHWSTPRSSCAFVGTTTGSKPVVVFGRNVIGAGAQVRRLRSANSALVDRPGDDLLGQGMRIAPCEAPLCHVLVQRFFPLVPRL